jgi:hypothetical protein
MTYSQLGEYKLADLKRALLRALAADSDILTQFIDESDCQRRLESAQSFAQVASVIRTMVGEDDVAVPSGGRDDAPGC